MTFTRHCIFLLVILIAYVKAWLPCPTFCSGHGVCRVNSTDVCDCFTGWQGNDCSRRSCPADYAWSGKAYGMDIAHVLTECSNQGTCDHNLGTCGCYKGFTGLACRETTCGANKCSGHGDCLTMDESYQLYSHGVQRRYNYSRWEGDHVTLCNCQIGYTGPDCSMRLCPKGDDPFTPKNTSRTIDITTTSSSDATGSFRFTFNDQSFLFPPAGIWTSDSCEVSFESLPNIGHVNCSVLQSSSQRQVYRVAFASWPILPYESNLFTNNGNPTLHQFGCDPSLVSASTSDDVVVSCTLSDVIGGSQGDTEGTLLPEYALCSNRGVCDFTSGQCNCFVGMTNVNCDSFFYGNRIYQEYITNASILHIVNKLNEFNRDLVFINNDAYEVNYFKALTYSDEDSLIFSLDNTGDLNLNYGGVTIGQNASFDGGGATIAIGGLAIDKNGGMTINSGGLTSEYFLNITGDVISYDTVNITDRMRVLSSGLIATEGGLTVLSGGLTTSDSLLLTAGGGTISLGGVSITGGVSIASGGAVIYRRGMTINSDGMVIENGGLSLLGSPVGLSVDQGLTIYGGGMRIQAGLSIATFGLTITSGLSIYTAGMVVTTSGMTIASGGLSITSGGATITSGGVLITAGGLTVNSGGLTIIAGGIQSPNGVSINTGGVVVSGGLTLYTNGMLTTGGLTISAGGLITSDSVSITPRGISTSAMTVNDIGATITGGVTITSGGLSITSGGLTITASGLKVAGGMTATDGMAVTGGVSISSSGMVVTTDGMIIRDAGFVITGGATINDYGLRVTTDGMTIAAGGVVFTANNLAISSNGMAITAGGMSVGSGGIIIATGGLTLSSNGMTVVGGATVTSNGLRAYGVSVNSAGLLSSAGPMVVLSAGMTATNGMTVNDLGLVVTASGLTVSAGGLSIISDGVTIYDDGLVIAGSGGISVTSNGMITPSTFTSSSGFQITDTGLTVTSNGLQVTGGVTITAGGLTIAADGVRVGTLGMTADSMSVSSNGTLLTDGMTISSGGVNILVNGLTITAGTVNIANGVTVLASGVYITGGLSIRDTGLWVSGGLTINSQGTRILSGGIQVIDNGMIVTTNGLTINDLGITSASSVVISTGGMYSDTSGATINDIGLTTTALTIGADGMLVATAGGMSITANGLAITTGGLTATADGLIITGGLTVSALAVTSGVTVAEDGLYLFGADNFQVLQGGVWTDQDVTVYGSTFAQSISGASDARFKQNVRSIDHAMDKVNSLHGYSYRMIEQRLQAGLQSAVVNSAEDDQEATKRHLGVLAQEVLIVLPEAVRRMGRDEDSMMGVDYNALIPVLIEAVKELASSEPFSFDAEVNTECGCDEEQLMTEVEELSRRLDSQQQRYIHLSQQLLQLKEMQRLEAMMEYEEELLLTVLTY